MSRHLPDRTEKIRQDGVDEGLPAYESEMSQSMRVRNGLPSYEEAVGDDWTEVNYPSDDEKSSDAKRGARLGRQQRSREQQPPCIHWSGSGCRMTANSRNCCSCVDERPVTESGLYPMYVDGEGWVEGATRWQYYCPSCQGMRIVWSET